VLANIDRTDDFLKAVAEIDNVRLVYVVTDEDGTFEAVSQQLPAHVEPVRLYEAYLRNFEIESGRGVL
jgi:adenine-specific DNA-methyltransferase